MSVGQMRDNFASTINCKVLRVLYRSVGPLTPTQVAERAGITPRQAQAALSDKARFSGRMSWRIRPGLYVIKGPKDRPPLPKEVTE